MPKKNHISAIITMPDSQDGLSTLYLNRGDGPYITDFATRAEYTQRLTAGPLPKKPDVNEIYKDAAIHDRDLHSIGITTASREYADCIKRFLKSI